MKGTKQISNRMSRHLNPTKERELPESISGLKRREPISPDYTLGYGPEILTIRSKQGDGRRRIKQKQRAAEAAKLKDLKHILSQDIDFKNFKDYLGFLEEGDRGVTSLLMSTDDIIQEEVAQLTFNDD